jgi:hypothetical protein
MDLEDRNTTRGNQSNIYGCIKRMNPILVTKSQKNSNDVVTVFCKYLHELRMDEDLLFSDIEPYSLRSPTQKYLRTSVINL